MIESLASREGLNALLAFEDKELPVASEEELLAALDRLPLLEDGQTATLMLGYKHFVCATRRGEFWSAMIRRGAWWTLASFTAEMTTDYSERQVKAHRAAASLWKRLAIIFASPPAEHRLSTGQVKTIFVEYFLGKRFSIPQSGA